MSVLTSLTTIRVQLSETYFGGFVFKISYNDKVLKDDAENQILKTKNDGYFFL